MSARTYLTRLAGGRLTVFRYDGADLTEEEVDWFNRTITTQLRTDHLVETSGYQQDAALYEADIQFGHARKSGEQITVHPLIHQLKDLLQRRNWKLASVSRILGMRDSALSEWMRGMLRPTLANVASAFGAAGYRLVPVPIRIEKTVRELVQEEEHRIMAQLSELGMQSADDSEQAA